MLDKPDLADETLVACLQESFSADITHVEFLPLGADNHSAVYRAWEVGGRVYFVRLRSGNFDSSSVTLLHYMYEQGLKPVIAPIPTQDGRLWTDLEHYKLSLFPYVQGHNMYDTSLPERLWLEFGQALKRLHGLTLSPEMAMRIRREQYDPTYRQSLFASLDWAAHETFTEPIARQCAALLRRRSAEIRSLIDRTAHLATLLQARQLEFVLCHADLHAGNLLVASGAEPGDSRLYIIDWDEITLASKERDLMYIGGGLLGNWRSPSEESDLFYLGYGPTQIDPVVLAYYRYERILTDLAIYAQELLAVRGSLVERERSFHYMASNFFPGGVLEIAIRADRT